MAMALVSAIACSVSAATATSIGIMLPLHTANGEHLGDAFKRYGAAAMMAVHHINTKDPALVSNIYQLIPANLNVTVIIRDTFSSPIVGIKGAIEMISENVDVIVGSYRSAVSGPVSLVAATTGTPTIAWASTAAAFKNKHNYPVFSRTAISDDVLASGFIEIISAMGWNEIALLFMDDLYGRGLAQETARSAHERDIAVAVLASFAEGGAGSLESAIETVKDSGAKVIVSILQTPDLPALAEAANAAGLLGPGFVWIGSGGMEVAVEAMAAPIGNLFSGWLVVDFDGWTPEAFDSVLRTTPLAALSSSLFPVTQTALESGRCDVYCAMIYDAVVTAAIAAGRTQQLETPGRPLDKAQLLQEIRSVEFNGTSGPVAFDEFGDRTSEQVPFIVKNIRRGLTAEGQPDLVSELTWRWQRGVGLERVSEEPPQWPGGVLPTWDTTGEVECGAGLVYSVEKRACDTCPAGSQEEQGACVRYDASIGIVFPLHNEVGERYSHAYTRLAASAMMAVHHINSRDTSLVRDAKELLPEGFKLVFDLRDSYQTKGVVINAVFDFINDGRHVIIGAGRSSITVPLCLTAQISETPVISFASTAGALEDRAAFPYLNRVVINDKTLALGTVQGMHELGWTRCSMVSVDDEFGRGLAQNVQGFAADVNLDIATLEIYTTGDAASIDKAVQQLKESGARVFLAVTHTKDFPLLLEAAKRAGISGPGFSWVFGGSLDTIMDNINNLPADQSRVLAQEMEGWISFEVDVMHGEIGERFHEVLTTVPLEHVNHSNFGGGLTEEAMTSGPCSQYCALFYDAIWAAALGIARSDVAQDGTLDKGALLSNIRTTAFYGASGEIELDHATGERTTKGVTVLAKNMQFNPDFTEPEGGGGGGRRDSTSERLKAVVAWRWEQQRGLEPLSSAPPVWPGGLRTWDAPLDGASCPPGWIFATRSLQCEACPPGTYQDLGSCIPCNVGTFAGYSGAVKCGLCHSGFANETGMSSCFECPAFASRRASSLGVDISECECDAGYFARHGPGTDCEACITGAVCAGGFAMPWPRPGYWGDSDCQELARNGTTHCPKWDKFLECPYSEDCRGGAAFECERGRKGRMCLYADSGFTVIGGRFWLECGAGSKLWTVAGILGVVVVWLCINAVASSTYVALNIAILFIQVTALISTYGLKWHPNLDYLRMVLNVANFDVAFVTPLCLFPGWTEVTSFYLQLMLPFIFGCFYTLFFACKKVWRSWRGTLEDVGYHPPAWRCIVKYFISFVLVNYLTAAIKCFACFRCIEFPNGHLYLSSSPSVKCWEGEHLAMVVISSLYILLVLIGLPVGLFLVIRKHQNNGTLHSVEVDWQWGFVHSAYEMQYKQWECMLIVRRFTIALITSAVSEPMIQAAVTMVLLTGSLAAHVFTRPFISNSADVLDFICLCGAMLYVQTGLLMYPQVTKLSQGRACFADVLDPFCRQDEELKEAVSYIALCGIVSTLLVALGFTLHMVRDVQSSAIARKGIERLTGSEDGELSAQASFNHSRRHIQASANKTTLGEMLDGPSLLRWVKQNKEIRRVSSNDSTSPFAFGPPGSVPENVSPLAMRLASGASHRRLSAEFGMTASSLNVLSASSNYIFVERELQALPIDLTQSSSDQTADVVRHLCELPGILDYLQWQHAEGVEGLGAFVRDLTKFYVSSQAAGDDHKWHVTALVKFEFRPVVSYWMMNAPPENREIFRELIETILDANHKALQVVHRVATIRAASSPIRAASSPKQSPKHGSKRKLPQLARHGMIGDRGGGGGGGGAEEEPAGGSHELADNGSWRGLMAEDNAPRKVTECDLPNEPEAEFLNVGGQPYAKLTRLSAVRGNGHDEKGTAQTAAATPSTVQVQVETEPLAAEQAAAVAHRQPQLQVDSEPRLPPMGHVTLDNRPGLFTVISSGKDGQSGGEGGHGGAGFGGAGGRMDPHTPLASAELIGSLPDIASAQLVWHVNEERS